MNPCLTSSFCSVSCSLLFRVDIWKELVGNTLWKNSTTSLSNSALIYTNISAAGFWMDPSRLFVTNYLIENYKEFSVKSNQSSWILTENFKSCVTRHCIPIIQVYGTTILTSVRKRSVHYHHCPVSNPFDFVFHRFQHLCPPITQASHYIATVPYRVCFQFSPFRKSDCFSIQIVIPFDRDIWASRSLNNSRGRLRPGTLSRCLKMIYFQSILVPHIDDFRCRTSSTGVTKTYAQPEAWKMRKLGRQNKAMEYERVQNDLQDR